MARRNEDLEERDDEPRREATETSLEKSKINADKSKTAVETDLEKMKARMNVFEEKLDKMDASGKDCLEKRKPI
jgi:archaellum component FlaC